MGDFFKKRRKEKEEYTKVTFRDKYKKGHSGAGKVVRIVLSVLLILFLVCAIFIYAKLKEIRRVSDDVPRVSPDSETFDNEGNTGSDISFVLTEGSLANGKEKVLDQVFISQRGCCRLLRQSADRALILARTSCQV